MDAAEITRRQARGEKGRQLRGQLLGDQRLGALIGTMHHALGFSASEITGLFGGLTTKIVQFYLDEYASFHKHILRLPLPAMAAELRQHWRELPAVMRSDSPWFQAGDTNADA
jgi:hypothetical protein